MADKDYRSRMELAQRQGDADSPAPRPRAPGVSARTDDLAAVHRKSRRAKARGSRPQPTAGPVQKKDKPGSEQAGDVHGSADRATRGPRAPLPYAATIQQSFGRFDVSGIAAFLGGDTDAALDDMGAEGFARGESVALRAGASLHTVAHEAAHVVQQRAGVSLAGGVGRAGDVYEQQADAVADAVVRGESAEPILAGELGEVAGPASSRIAVPGEQLQLKKGDPTKADHDGPPAGLDWDKNDDSLADDAKTPVDWSNALSRPPNPLVPIKVAVTRDPPAGVKRRKEHPGHHPRDDKFEQDPQLRRLVFWSDFSDKCKQVTATHAETAAAVARYNDVESDPDLEALGFEMTEKGEGEQANNLEELANQQQLPKRGGESVGELFTGTNLNLSKRDRAAVRRSGRARKRGKGDVDEQVQQTYASDKELQSQLKKVRSAAAAVVAATEKHKAAMSAISAERSRVAAEDAKREIRELEGDSQNSQDASGRIFAVVTGILHASAGGLGNAMEQVGIAASLVVNHGNDVKIQAAQARLKIATRDMRSAIAAELQANLNAAVSGITTALLDLSAQKDQLLKALAGRKTEYGRLGAAAASTAGGSAANRDKVASTMAAIPIVEIVISRAKQISDGSRPPRFEASAGRGLAMAQADKRVVAADFLRACGELNQIHSGYGLTAHEWRLRLEKLNKVKRTLIGRRPKGRND